MSELRKSIGCSTKNWDDNVKSVRMVASFLSFLLLSLRGINMLNANLEGNKLVGNTDLFGDYVSNIGFLYFYKFATQLFLKFGRLLTWILLSLLLFVFTFTSVYVLWI